MANPKQVPLGAWRPRWFLGHVPGHVEVSEAPFLQTEVPHFVCKVQKSLDNARNILLTA